MIATRAILKMPQGITTVVNVQAAIPPRDGQLLHSITRVTPIAKYAIQKMPPEIIIVTNALPATQPSPGEELLRRMKEQQIVFPVIRTTRPTHIMRDNAPIVIILPMDGIITVLTIPVFLIVHPAMLGMLPQIIIRGNAHNVIPPVGGLAVGLITMGRQIVYPVILKMPPQTIILVSVQIAIILEMDGHLLPLTMQDTPIAFPAIAVTRHPTIIPGNVQIATIQTVIGMTLHLIMAGLRIAFPATPMMHQQTTTLGSVPIAIIPIVGQELYSTILVLQTV